MAGGQERPPPTNVNCCWFSPCIKGVHKVTSFFIYVCIYGYFRVLYGYFSFFVRVVRSFCTGISVFTTSKPNLSGPFRTCQIFELTKFCQSSPIVKSAVILPGGSIIFVKGQTCLVNSGRSSSDALCLGKSHWLPLLFTILLIIVALLWCLFTATPKIKRSKGRSDTISDGGEGQ